MTNGDATPRDSTAIASTSSGSIISQRVAHAKISTATVHGSLRIEVVSLRVVAHATRGLSRGVACPVTRACAKTKDTKIMAMTSAMQCIFGERERSN